MNGFQRIASAAQEMDRISQGATSREFYGMKPPMSKPRKFLRRLKWVLLLLLVLAAVLLLMFWSKLHIVWMIH